MVNKDNFHIHTKAIWVRLKHNDYAFDLFDQLKAAEGLEVIRPYASGSVYIIDDAAQLVYRLSDHWGRVSSCFWSLDHPLQDWQVRKRVHVIAKAHFSDFIQYGDND